MDRAPGDRDLRERHSRFLSKLGHELRTPLGSVLMLAEMLADGDAGGLGDRRRQQARKIHQAASEMRALLDEVSLLAKIEGGRLELFEADVALADLVRELEEKLRRAGPPGVAVEPGPDLPARVRTDRARLVEILEKLVEGALRAGGDAAVRIGRTANGEALEIAVDDTGPAIAAAERQAIFEPFSQADPRTRRPRGGRSLRLTVARALARLLGGELTLAPSGESGNTFVLLLPL